MLHCIQKRAEPAVSWESLADGKRLVKESNVLNTENGKEGFSVEKASLGRLPAETRKARRHTVLKQMKANYFLYLFLLPATAYLLQGVPAYGGAVRAELCTPTGAALLKHFASRFGEMPVMTTQAVGYGMGTKEFAAANCLRAFWGDTQ